MKLKASTVKKIVIIVSIILPLLFYQVVIYYNYSYYTSNVLLEESSDELELISHRFNAMWEKQSARLMAIHEALYISNGSIDDYRALGETLVYSKERALSTKERELVKYIRTLEMSDKAYDILEGNLYLYDYNVNNNSYLIKVLSLQDLIETLLENNDGLKASLYFEGRLIYTTSLEHQVALSNETAMAISDNEVVYHMVVDDQLDIMIKKTLDDQLGQTRRDAIIQTLIMSIVLGLFAGLILRKVSKENSEVEGIIHELKRIDRALERMESRTLKEIEASFLLSQDVRNKLNYYQSNAKTLIDENIYINDEITRMNAQYESHIFIENKNMQLIKSLEQDFNNIDYFMTEFVGFVDQVLIQINKEGKVVRANQTFYNKFKYDRQDEINIADIIKTPSDKKDIVDKLLTVNEEPVFINILFKGSENKSSEFLSFKSIEWDEGLILLVGKSIHDEITLQSRILRKNRELEYINQINSALISNWGFDELIENIIKKIDYLFSAAICEIFVKENEEWVLKASTKRMHQMNQFKIKDLNDYFKFDVNSTNQLEMITHTKDYQEDCGLEGSIEKIVLAPLEVNNNLLAMMVIGVDNKINTNDINILKMFKNQASIVIQRSLLYDELSRQYFNTIEALVNVIEAKDKYTEGHSRRVSRFAVEIANKMGYSNEDVEKIEIAGLLHDVGKVGINQKILTKRGRLTNAEYEEIKEHPEKGIQILKAIKLDPQINEGILYHHIHYNLGGYPANHQLKVLPPYAAIIGVADAFDAMTSARSYTVAKTVDAALEELIRCSGSQFSPDVVKAMQEIVEERRDKLEIIIGDMRSYYGISSTI